ncbi:hypothetical protein FA95DRAFT_1552350 [Auriscalpium vulgare]|uniref:Uncharacterized protein n=1 Tax=Auriscalpium vulgare TaxID=40419 RepID=A0ACB8S9J6_9AGAM|nr:hypothetical protein FA95DRAFT_1552350 [Auriscalpium vulgare]
MFQPTLKHFILQQQVLDLYRLAIRASRAIPDPNARKETVLWIRGEFERNRHIQDLVQVPSPPVGFPRIDRIRAENH